MNLYNTLTKKVEEFIPVDPKNVKMYTCGPTVYHYAHIGNLRTYICEDILEKSLNYLGYHVKRVMNITPVHCFFSGRQNDFVIKHIIIISIPENVILTPARKN